MIRIGSDSLGKNDLNAIVVDQDGGVWQELGLLV